MRPRSAIVLALMTGLVSASSAASAAPSKKRAAAGKKWHPKPKTKPAAESPAPAAPPAGDNPYGTTETAPLASPPTEATDTTPSASAPESSSSTSGDAKLDAPPPPRSTAEQGPKPSPLNPEPPESPKSVPAAAPVELSRLVSDIAALRARVAALTTSLFSSKLRIYARAEGDEARIEAFTVTLDDGVVFHGDTNLTSDDEKVVYDHAVAPGNHVVGIEVERHDARGPAFRTWQTTRFAIQVPERQTLEAIVVIDDDSDMGKDFPSDQDGQYDLEVKLRAKVAD